jgi:hypothetical protein
MNKENRRMSVFHDACIVLGTQKFPHGCICLVIKQQLELNATKRKKPCWLAKRYFLA